MTKIKPKKNPFYMGEEDINFMQKKAKFHSDVFVITRDGMGDDNEEYEELMNNMYPFDQSSNNILNPYGNITRSVNKDGDLMIHIEWLELEDEKDHLKEKAKAIAKKKGKGDDKEFIEKTYRKLGGEDYISW